MEKEELIDLLTAIIFTSSVQHAAVNFGQYDQFGYPFHYPTMLRGTPPKDKVTKNNLLNRNPSREQNHRILISHKSENKIMKLKGTHTVYFSIFMPQCQSNAYSPKMDFHHESRFACFSKFILALTYQRVLNSANIIKVHI